jgi:hypothetical protein
MDFFWWRENIFIWFTGQVRIREMDKQGCRLVRLVKMEQRFQWGLEKFGITPNIGILKVGGSFIF